MIPEGSIPLKAWLIDQAERLGRPINSVLEYYYRIKPPISVVRINRRVVLVPPGQTLAMSPKNEKHGDLVDSLTTAEYHLRYMRKQRAKFRAAGLTVLGKQRKRKYNPK